jgi:hypothetical protein
MPRSTRKKSKTGIYHVMLRVNTEPSPVHLGNWKPEGMSTQLAERYGYDYKVNPIEQLNHVGYTIGSLIIRKIRGK